MDYTSKASTPVGSDVVKRQGLYLARDFLQARESCWIPLGDKLVFIGCGDDRPPTPESTDVLMADKGDRVMHPMRGYASIYGATAGLAKNSLVVGAAQFGDSFITAVDGFDGIMKLLVDNSSNPQTLHSAVANEQSPRHFSCDSESPIGCAYAAGIGATADLLARSSSAIRDTARADQQYVFGSDDGFDQLLRGQRAFLDHVQAHFAVNRNHYRRYRQQFSDRLGIMILEGAHTGAKTSGVISNFSLTEVGSSVIAHEQQLDFYRLDIAVATDVILRTLSKPLLKLSPNYVLSPELLMRSFQLDSTPVRAVLASADRDSRLAGKLDPLNLRMGVRGNPFEAIQILRGRYA